MNRKILSITIILGIFAQSYCLKISAPIRWRSSGYLARLVPRTEKYFVDGMMDASIDMLEIKSNNLEATFFLRSTIWTGMGYQWEDIIFDPRYMHYSLVPGIRSNFKIGSKKYSLAFQWYHDCFHEVDRKEEPTIIWNIFELRLSPTEFLATERRDFFNNKNANSHTSKKLTHNAPHFYLKFFWDIGVGIFPRFHNPAWFQYTHPLNDRIDANLQISFIQYKSLHCEFAYNPTLYFQNGGETSQRQYIELSIKHYGSGGTFSLFWGYTFVETQPVRPKPDRVWLGTRWEF
ncbi:hypothetical protein DRQ26_02130 [bacterium]|nr:MAG: hypothetical protein DRQ26_02130 [bacterium]